MHRVVSIAVVCLVASTAAAAPTFDSRPVPPRALDGIRAGMAIADAQAALAAFAPDAAYRDAANRTRLVKDAGGGARYYVLVKAGVISRIGIEAEARGLEPKLTRLWGAPVRSTNGAAESIASWSKAGWRAELSCRGELCRMAFHRALTAEFFGAAIAPPGPLATLRPGMTRDEIAKLAPLHAAGAEVPAGPEDVRLAVDVEKTGYLRSILVGGLPANAGELLAAAWGAPAERGEDGVVWVDGERGWRAIYEPALHSVQLVGFLAPDKLLGGGPAIAALAQPILGATRDQIIARYPGFRAGATGGTVVLPATLSTGSPVTPVAITISTTGRATRLAIPFPIDGAARRDALVKLMEAKWGAAAIRTVPGSGRVYVFADGKLRIEAVEGDAVLELRLQLQ